MAKIFRDSKAANNLRPVDVRDRWSIEEPFNFASAEVWDGIARPGEDGFSPIAAAVFEGNTVNPRKPCNPLLPYVTDSAFRTFGWWLFEAQNVPAGGMNIEYEIRGGLGETESKVIEVLTTGTMVLNTPDQTGLITQVTGVLASRIEFWARVSILNSTQPIPLRLGLIADRFGGPIKQVQKGSLTP